jgi:hypothetical protein
MHGAVIVIRERRAGIAGRLPPGADHFDTEGLSRLLLGGIDPGDQREMLSLDPPIRECGGWFLDAAQGVACGRSR